MDDQQVNSCRLEMLQPLPNTAAVAGPAQAFFYAAARGLLVTSWPVETTRAMALTTGLFQRYAKTSGLERSEALRSTMLDLVDGAGSQGFSYAHPIFRAPYMLVGDGN